MCTAIAFKGNDLLYGFNLDIDPETWNFAIFKTKQLFAVGITVGKTVYYTHGVTKDDRFGNVPYMNGAVFPVPHGAKRERIDLMTDRYLRGKYSYEDILQILRTKTVVNVPAATMHSLIGDPQGEILIVEPGYGHRAVTEHYAVLTNFPVLTRLQDTSNPFYGIDRYEKAAAVLQHSPPEFSVTEALRLLDSVKAEGKWGTRVSFVYSRNEQAVYYFLNGDSTDIRIHRF